MNEATTTQPDIDPDFLHGRAAQALELLPDDPQLERLTEQLQEAYIDFQRTRKRVDRQMEQWRAVDAEVRAADDEDERAALSVKRVALAGELVHSPNDVASVAKVWGHTLFAWADHVRPRAHRLAEEAATLARPIERDRHRLSHGLEPGLPSTAAPTPEQRAGLQETIGRASEALRPHAALREAALSLEQGAKSELTTRFGDGEPPDGYIPNGRISDWVEAIRSQTAAHTQAANPLTSDALRPTGTLV
jgi:hypothetical protein